MMDSEEQETGQNSLTPPSQEERDEYEICIEVSPTGYTISKEGSEPVEASTSTEMLKTVLSIVQANPLEDDAQKQMEAGYTS